MATRRALTGGTGDVNPQWFTLNATQSGADATTTDSFPIPVQRLPSGRGAQVMEIFTVVWWPGNTVVSAASNTITLSVTTRNFGTTAVPLNDASQIARFRRSITTSTAVGHMVNDEPYVMNLTDGAGHGILVATDSIFVQLVSTTTSQTVDAVVRLFYRWKNVGLAEYVGIVQSQTSS